MPKRKMLGSVSEFSFTEMVSNNTGKTSASGTMGVLICTIGAICFLVGSIALISKKTDSTDILIQSIGMVYAGALLLGYRKSTDKAEIESGIENEPLEPKCPEEDNNSSEELSISVKSKKTPKPPKFKDNDSDADIDADDSKASKFALKRAGKLNS